jgi:hypothetical protein
VDEIFDGQTGDRGLPPAHARAHGGHTDTMRDEAQGTRAKQSYRFLFKGINKCDGPRACAALLKKWGGGERGEAFWPPAHNSSRDRLKGDTMWCIMSK